MRTRASCSVAAAAATLLALTACSSTIDGNDLEEQIKTQLEAEEGDEVDCPDDIAAEAGTEFVCSLTASDGSTAKVEGTITDDEGTFEAEVVEG